MVEGETEMRVKPIKELVLGIIEERKQKLRAEIDDIRTRQAQEASYWGLNGAYNRKEQAIKKRKEQLEELEATELQVKGLVQLKEEFYYKLHCNECGNTWTSTMQPSGDYHECPYCKKLVYENAPQRYKRLAGREDWMKKW